MCSSCTEVKPRFYISPEGTLIKITRPMERLSIDFKEPILSVTTNTYLLVVIDEYSVSICLSVSKHAHYHNNEGLR